MNNNENLIPIPGRLHSVATEGHVAGADEIYDDTKQKNQATINSELIEAVGTGGSVDTRITNAVNVEKTRAEGAESTLDSKITAEQTRATSTENALDDRVDTLEEAVGTGGSVDSRIEAAVATETSRAQEAESTLQNGITTETARAQGAETGLNSRVTTNESNIEALQEAYRAITQGQPIPKTSEEWTAMTSWEEGVVYRVQGTTSYADYMYNGTTTIKMAEYDNAIDNVPTAGSNNLVKSGGVYATIKALEDAGYIFAGVATPTTNPGTPDGPVFYLTSEGGTYTNFNAIELQDGLSVLMWNDSWSSQQIFGVSDVPISESEDLVKGSGVLSKYAPLGGIIYRSKNSMNNNHTVRFDVGYTCWNKDMILTWENNSSINLVSILCYSKDYGQQLLYTENDIFNIPQNTAIIIATFDNGDSSTAIEANLSFYGTSQKLDKILQKNWDFGYSYGQLPNVDTLGMTINFGSSAYIKLPYIGIDLGNFTDIPLVDTSLNTSLQILVYNIKKNSFVIKSYTYSPKDDEIILCITRWSTHEPVQKVLDVFSKFDVTYDGIRNQSGLVLSSITSIDKLWCNLVWYTQYHTRVMFEIDNTPYSEINISLDASQDYDVDVLNAENWEGTHYDETGWKKSVVGYKATKKDAKKIFVLFRKSNNEEITVADVALIKAAIVQCDIKNILLKGNANNNLLYQLNKKIAIDRNPNIISIAHQGFCFNNPSQFSTKESFLRAADYGFRWTEGDIKFSSDLVPVLNHDLTFEDVSTHETITISEHTYAELLTYDYKGGTICSFDEVMAICKTSGMGFVIDHLDWTVDTDQKLNIIFNIVQKYRMENNVIWNIQNIGKVDKITQFYKYSIFQILNGYSSESLSLANSIKTDFNRVIISQDIILDKQGTPRTITPQEIITFSENVNNGIELALWTFDYISTFNTLAPYVNWVTTNILTF